MECGAPYAPNVIETHTTTSYLASFEFTCETGYKRTGASSLHNNITVVCLGTGLWDYGSLFCARKISVFNILKFFIMQEISVDKCRILWFYGVIKNMV